MKRDLSDKRRYAPTTTYDGGNSSLNAARCSEPGTFSLFGGPEPSEGLRSKNLSSTSKMDFDMIIGVKGCCMHHIIGVRNGTLTLTLGHRLTIIIDATAAAAPNSSTTLPDVPGPDWGSGNSISMRPQIRPWLVLSAQRL